MVNMQGCVRDIYQGYYDQIKEDYIGGTCSMNGGVQI
jgi:hypothetical protein